MEHQAAEGMVNFAKFARQNQYFMGCRKRYGASDAGAPRGRRRLIKSGAIVAW
jgi:hypothetical protein